MLFHYKSLLFDLLLHLVAIEVIYVAEHVGSDLVLRAPHILPHLFNLLELSEELVGLLSCLEDFISCVRSNFFQLLLSEKDQAL